MTVLTDLARPVQSHPAFTRLGLAKQKVIRTARFNFGLSEAQLQGFDNDFDRAFKLIDQFQKAADVIKSDVNLSSQGKQIRLDGLRQDTNSKLNAFGASVDRTEMVEDHKARQQAKAAAVRRTFHPESELLAFWQGQQLVQRLEADQAKFEEKAGTALTRSEKLEGGPLLKALMDAAASYTPAPTKPEQVAANKKRELIISAILDSPIDIVPEEYHRRVEEHLLQNLAVEETEKLREVTAYHQTLATFTNDLKEIVNRG